MARIAFLLLILATSHKVSAQTCDFSHITTEVPLFSEYTENVTDAIRQDQGAWSNIATLFPHVKKVFSSQEPYISVFVGWLELEDELASMSENQVRSSLYQLGELGKQRAQREGQQLEIIYADSSPYAFETVHDYDDGGDSFRDKSITVLAPPKCVLTITASAIREDINWEFIDEQFQLIRSAVARYYGDVQYSTEGKRFTRAELRHEAVVLPLLAIIAWFFSRFINGRYEVSSYKTTRRYSALIATVSLLAIVLTVWSNEYVGIGIVTLSYSKIFHFGLVAFFHTWSYRSKSTKVISFAIGFVVASMLLSIPLWLSGLYPTTPNMMIGAFVGAVIVAYTIGRGFSRRTLKLREARISDLYVGLPLLAFATFLYFMLTEPVAPDGWSYHFGRAAGQVLGGALLGMIVWLPLRLIRGSEKAPRAENIIIYTAMVVVVLVNYSLRYL